MPIQYTVQLFFFSYKTTISVTEARWNLAVLMLSYAHASWYTPFPSSLHIYCRCVMPPMLLMRCESPESPSRPVVEPLPPLPSPLPPLPLPTPLPAVPRVSSRNSYPTNRGPPPRPPRAERIVEAPRRVQGRGGSAGEGQDRDGGTGRAGTPKVRAGAPYGVTGFADSV